MHEQLEYHLFMHLMVVCSLRANCDSANGGNTSSVSDLINVLHDNLPSQGPVIKKNLQENVWIACFSSPLLSSFQRMDLPEVRLGLPAVPMLRQAGPSEVCMVHVFLKIGTRSPVARLLP